MTAPFYNPFKNWPFAITPGGNGTLGTLIECSCEVIDGKHYRHDGYQCPAENVRQPSPDQQFTKTPPQHAGFKEAHDGQHHEDASKAIEALKALKVTQIASTTKQQKPAGKENTGSGPANQGSNNENMPKPTSNLPATTGDQIEKRGTVKRIFGDSTNQHNQVLMDYRSPLYAPPALGMNNKWSGVTNSPNTFTPTPPVPEFMENSTRDSKSKTKALWSVQGGPFPSQFLDIPSRSRAPPSSPQNFQAPGIFDDNDPCTPKGRGKIVVGCSQCRFHPIIKAIPCGCCMCYECCGRFCTSVTSGSIVYCGCGERVVSIVNVADPLTTGYPGTPQTLYHPSTQYSPITAYTPSSVMPYTPSPASPNTPVFASPTPGGIVVSPWNDEPTIPSALHAQALMTAAQMAGISNPSLGSPGNCGTMTRMLSMDAETAIRSAPFVELGKQAIKQAWTCVKIGNIPYNVTSEELADFLGLNANLAPEHMGSIGIHVIMDRSTGKTMDAYAEFMSSEDAWRCVSRRRSRVLGSRHLTLEVVDQSELMKDIFPRAKGIVWEGITPKKGIQGDYDTRVEIVNREELTQIVNHAKTPHRSPFSRKCLPRPFQSLMSIVSKFPWFATNMYTIAQRDFIFNALWTAIDILKRSIKRGGTTPNLDVELLKALLCVGIRCAGFTDAQKYELVKTAEFGADGVQVDEDIGILSGFEALGKAIGAERRVLEFYALLLELSVSPFLSEPTTQGLAAAELIRARNIQKQHPEESKKAHLTMQEAAIMEITIIENAVRTVLLSKSLHAKKRRH